MVTSVDQTFERLRRDPIAQVYTGVADYMRQVARQNGLNSVGFRHPAVTEYILKRGYTPEEIIGHYLEKFDF